MDTRLDPLVRWVSQAVPVRGRRDETPGAVTAARATGGGTVSGTV